MRCFFIHKMQNLLITFNMDLLRDNLNDVLTFVGYNKEGLNTKQVLNSKSQFGTNIHEKGKKTGRYRTRSAQPSSQAHIERPYIFSSIFISLFSNAEFSMPCAISCVRQCTESTLSTSCTVTVPGVSVMELASIARAAFVLRGVT